MVQIMEEVIIEWKPKLICLPMKVEARSGICVLWISWMEWSEIDFKLFLPFANALHRNHIIQD